MFNIKEFLTLLLILSLSFIILNLAIIDMSRDYKETVQTSNYVFVALGGNYAKNINSFINLFESSMRVSPDSVLKLFVKNGRVSQKVINFVSTNSRVELVYCSELVTPYYSTRFRCYLNELETLQKNDKIALVDTDDVYFTNNIFEIIEDGIYLAEEPEYFKMSKCPHHVRWIRDCKNYGPKVWESIKENPMICAGTILGVQESLKEFLSQFVDILESSKCNDQGVLNAMYYTDNINTDITLFEYNDNVIKHMNVAKQYDYIDSYLVHTGDNRKARKVMAEYSLFKNVLSYEEDQAAKDLLKNLDVFLYENNIDYVIDGGTLIGAVLHGNRIPWDDDFDIYIEEKDVGRFRKAVSKHSSFRLVGSYNGLYFKIYDSLIRKARVSNYNWPFIDVGILISNETHIWEKRIKEKKYSHHIYKKEWLFPSKRLQYSDIELSAPRFPQAFLSSRFGYDWYKKCVYANWDHKFERVRNPQIGDGNKKIVIPCRNLSWLRYSHDLV